MGKALSEIAIASPEVLDRIKQSIMPDGRGARVSTLVEDAQYSVLGSVGENAIEQAAFRANEGKRFTVECYNNPICLRAYLIEFFSENVLKLQLILYDLLSSRKLPARLNVLDIGVGTGTSAIAILDFFRIWADACPVGENFPINSLRITGIDRLTSPLKFSKDVVQAYASALQDYGDNQSNTSRRSRLGRIADWAESGIAWDDHDFFTSPLSIDNQNLIVASNVLNELRKRPCGEYNFNNVVANLANMGLAIIIELSVAQTSADSELGAWYRGFLDSCPKNIRHEFSVVSDGKRRERFNPHPLNLQFFKLRSKSEKREISWRHRVVQRSVCWPGAVSPTESTRDHSSLILNGQSKTSCQDDPSKLVAYIRECLGASPPNNALAVDAFERLLRTGAPQSLSDLLRWANANGECAGVSRIRHSATFFHEISSWRSGRATGIDLHSAEDFISLREALHSRDSVERADMLVAVIQVQRSKFSKM